MKPPGPSAGLQRALTFDDNPPLSVPLRFFLSAPLFAALAALLLLWQGEAAWSTRWSPHTLALAHLLTLGCLTMCMMGALLQMLPVVAGTAVPKVRLVGALAHALLCAGTLLLAGAFWLQSAILFPLALAALLPALLLFIGACTVALWRQQSSGAGAVVAAIRLSLAALAVTAALGALLAGAYFTPALAALPLTRLTDLHAMWGLLGWVGLLIIGVAFQVVPMFQVTEPYPRGLTGGYATALFIGLIAVSVSGSLTADAVAPFHHLLQAALLAGYAAFAATTLWLLAHRKRPKADPTTLYWRCAMASLLAALALWMLPAAPGDNAPALAIGVLLVAGFALSIISGMLYKIVPFLVWYHLQTTLPGGCRSIPGVNKMVPEKHARLQFALHALALLLLLAACYLPALVRVAAAVLCLASLALWFNLFAVTRLYLRLRLPATAQAGLSAA